MKHNKHSNLSKPIKGFYGRNEVSLLGSDCRQIQTLASFIGDQLRDKFSLSYVDADHASNNDLIKKHSSNPFIKTFINKISHKQFEFFDSVYNYEENGFFDSTDLILVNGNHEQANHQIVIIDPKKKTSLLKRKASLTNVIALLWTNSKKEIPEYIKELIPEYSTLPKFLVSDEKGIGNFINLFLENRKPKIQGLILGGGKSTRMGVDKIFINYHGKSQYSYLQEIMKPFCEDVFTSCRADQSSLFSNVITDSFIGLGAYGGLLSAFQKKPNSSWFTVACDIPLLNNKTIETLVKSRNPSKLATCFYNSNTDFPEPLITIWEPRAYPVLLYYLSLGYSCTRKVLINSDVEIVKLDNENVLLNANTIEESNRAVELLSDFNK